MGAPDRAPDRARIPYARGARRAMLGRMNPIALEDALTAAVLILLALVVLATGLIRRRPPRLPPAPPEDPRDWDLENRR